MVLNEIESWPKRAKELILGADGEEALVDVLGQLNSAERGIGDERRRAAGEVVHGTSGERWAFEQGRRAVRSFNNSSLLSKFMEAFESDPWHTLKQLIAADALRVSWQYTNLTRVAEKAGVQLSETNVAVADGDEHDIGAVWQDASPRYVPIEAG